MHQNIFTGEKYTCLCHAYAYGTDQWFLLLGADGAEWFMEHLEGILTVDGAAVRPILLETRDAD